ncbi:HK97-gp10 family putative phage morphogenesis protein [Rothia sp. 32237D007AR]
MAKAQITLPTKFLDALDAAASQVDAFAADALKAGAAIVEPRMRTNLTGAIGHSKRPSQSTGQLLAALGTSPVGATSKGTINIKIGFAENRRDGTSHAKIATILEYGSSRQQPRPFLAPTRAQTRTAAVKAMKQTMATKFGGISP